MLTLNSTVKCPSALVRTSSKKNGGYSLLFCAIASLDLHDPRRSGGEQMDQYKLQYCSLQSWQHILLVLLNHLHQVVEHLCFASKWAYLEAGVELLQIAMYCSLRLCTTTHCSRWERYLPQHPRLDQQPTILKIQVIASRSSASEASPRISPSHTNLSI